eukprot:CAMPEP_0171192008 /NCGR_PEP_ID=MMETSP0790-20130122/19653_1 /TAXON_ID=2925 /ORGANISM="Alexandrium catenella, Strain OF101" /LENGTH=302 /DNA_ID=CAMNT_0011657163 /DNA_START=40 /DNA_END=948 /DNA_ORIENTATION=+
MTSKQASPAHLVPAVKANLEKNLQMESGLELRWLDDSMCLDYLKEHFGAKFAQRLENEPRGSYRGDLCRAAVLFREGGFYIDLDVQLKVPLTRLVDSNTTFMTAFTVDGAVLNAVVAAEPRNEIMAETLRELRRWYDGDASHEADEEKEKTQSQWMGPLTMLRGLRVVMERSCPGVSLEMQRQVASWECGTQHFRFYDERDLACDYTGDADPNSECPPSRANSEFPGSRFGIFEPNPQWDKRVLVAWPRFEACDDWGCKGGGWDEGANPKSAEPPKGTEEDLLDSPKISKDDSDGSANPKDL